MMDRREIARKGGQALVAKRGREYMSTIGKRGWQATIISVAERQQDQWDNPGWSIRRLLPNLKKAKVRT